MTEAHDQELELKYVVIDPAGADALLARDELEGLKAVGPTRAVQHEDRYFDTVEGALARAGFGARIRQHAGKTVVTVKSLARQGAGALHRREELEGPGRFGQPPRDWPASAARSLVLEHAGDAPLVEVLTIRQLRRKREYRGPDTVVEVSLDEVDVVVQGEVLDRFEELEVELMEGSPEIMDRLTDAIADVPGLGVVEGSKLVRALDAVQSRERSRGRLPQAVLAAAMARAGGGNGASPDAAAVADAVTDHDRRRRTVSPRDRGKKRRRNEQGTSEATPPAAAAADASGDALADKPAGSRDGAPDGAPASAPDPSPSSGDTAASIAIAVASPSVEPIDIGKTPGVAADDHVAEAGRKVLRFHLARMIAREPGTRVGVDAEELHAMRVATRRQRAAWRVFGAAFDRDATQRHEKRLRQVARRLGEVRDLDVLIEGFEGYRKAQPASDRPLLEPLVASWHRQREAARERLVAELDAPKHVQWLRSYRMFVLTEGAAALPVGAVSPHRVRDTMPSRIWAAYEGVRAYEGVLRWADVTTLHDLRIAGKWLRYTLEFGRDALGTTSGPLIEKVVALQDHLGLLNDADVAAGLARTFLVEHAGDLSEREGAAIGRYLVDREHEIGRLRRSMGPVWRGVSSLAYRRALGRVLAGL